MRSRAQIKGHPIHPILVSFPIVFFTGTLLFDILGAFFEGNNFHTTARYLNIAGIASGLLAAIPGIVDYFFVIPPKSSGKKRGAKHGLINLSVILLFSLILFFRKEGVSLNVLIGLESLGVVLLSIAGWLGGTLVYRNQVGVDIRYAHAGKWKEVYIKEKGGEVPVAAIDELKVNQMKLVHVAGKRVVVCRTEKGYAAFDDHCTHRGGSLAGGSMICGKVQCPWHGSQFDIETGNVYAGPAKDGIAVYPVRESGNDVLLML